MTSSLTKVVRDVARDFAAQGRPLPVPPDRMDTATENARDREFWAEVDRRMAELERAHLDRGPAGRGETDAGSPRNRDAFGTLS